VLFKDASILAQDHQVLMSEPGGQKIQDLEVSAPMVRDILLRVQGPSVIVLLRNDAGHAMSHVIDESGSSAQPRISTVS